MYVILNQLLRLISCPTKRKILKIPRDFSFMF